MATCKKRVLIIDNQYTQYSSLSKSFPKAEYEVYPDKESYKTFMDNVKIIIDPRYEEIKNYQEDSILFIKKCIEEFQPDAFIIDYILGGSHSCETGIELAERIVNGKKPVLFVSIENKNNQYVIKQLKNYPWMSDWAEKGYFQWYGKADGNNEVKGFYNSNIVSKTNSLIERCYSILPVLLKIMGDLDKLRNRDIYLKKEDNRVPIDSLIGLIDFFNRSEQKRIPNAIIDLNLEDINTFVYKAYYEIHDDFTTPQWRKLSKLRDILLEVKNA